MSVALSAENLEGLLDAMRSHGIVYNTKDNGPIDADGELHRFRVDGDPSGRRNGWYCVHGDARPAGAFGCYKRWGDQRFSWTAEGTTPLTREEREALAAAQREQRARKAAEEAVRHAHAQARAVAMWEGSAPAEAHPYLTRKGISAHGARLGDWIVEKKDGGTYVKTKGALLIPIKDATGLVSLQAIFPKPQGEDNRDKDFIYGGKKLGCWTTIGRPTELNGQVVLIVCEGFATGSSLHEATGLAAVPAFDAGNLIHVARELRRLMPESRILLAGDNDRWTERPIANPGLSRARDAARAVGGEWLVPEFADLDGEPTDFNDLYCREGLDEVRRQIMAVLDPPEAVEEEPPPWAAEDYGPIDEAPAGPASPASVETSVYSPPNAHFTILGHDRAAIFVYQHEMKMIVSRGWADWSEAAMTGIAALNWWESEFPADKGFDKRAALNWLQRAAFSKGFFDPNSCRGRGAWRDDGRIVFHFGNKLWVDGQIMDLTKIDSSYVYEQGQHMRLPADVAMTAEEGRRIFETSQLFSWTRPASAILLAGWIALAPICGALRWRPHVWITGGAGCGKSTVLGDFAHRLMNGACVYAQGNSTEAGIRQTLRTDARPVLFDETEQNNEKEVLRVQAVLALIRQSSTESEAKTLKGTQGGSAMDFMIRSMFCLSSIQVGMKQQADMERVTILALRPKKADGGDHEAAANWAKISAGIAWLRDDQVGARLMRRSLELLPVTVQNIDIFAQAAAERFGSQRDGDQYGAMLAGAWSLVSDKVASLAEARAMIDRYDWSDYLEGSETEESDKALNALLGRLVRVKGAVEVSLYEVIMRAAGREVQMKDVSTKDARQILKRYGLALDWEDREPENAGLLVAYKHEELDRLMKDTPYSADLKGQLLRIPGAERHAQPVRFLGVLSRAVRVPLTLILNGAPPAADDPVTGYSDDFDDRVAF